MTKDLKTGKSKLVKIILGTIILCATFDALANPYEYSTKLQPYLGIDVSQRSLAMVSGYGKGIFDKHILQNNLSLGIRLNQFIGIEAGQIFTQNVSRTTLVNRNEILFSVPYTQSDFLVSENRFQLYGTHLNFTAQYPINQSKLHIIGSLGLVSLKVKAEHKVILDEFGILPPDQVAGTIRKFSSRKAIPRLSGGLNYQITETVGLRMLTGYETTAKFKNMVAKRLNGASSTNRMSLKNNVNMGFGITVRFQ